MQHLKQHLIFGVSETWLSESVSDNEVRVDGLLIVYSKGIQLC